MAHGRAPEASAVAECDGVRERRAFGVGVGEPRAELSDRVGVEVAAPEPSVFMRSGRRLHRAWIGHEPHRTRVGSAYHRRVRSRSEPGVARTIVTFVLIGTLGLVAVAVVGFLVIREVATRQALDDAKQLTALSGRLVQRRLEPGVLTGDAAALGLLDRVVRDAVLIDPVVRVKVWGPDGTILYSDDVQQIGHQYESGRTELADLAPGEVAAEVSDLTAPENQGEQGFGELLEVYTPIEGPGGTHLLFETYQLRASVDEAQQQLLRAFVPVLVVALVAFALLMIPLAWSLARRLQRGTRERERLLQRAAAASEQERRRIAADLHDGPVQDLAGLSMRLAAEAEDAGQPGQQRALRETATAVRGAVRTLRSAIVGIYPPNLESAGLGRRFRSDRQARVGGGGRRPGGR